MAPRQKKLNKIYIQKRCQTFFSDVIYLIKNGKGTKTELPGGGKKKKTTVQYKRCS